MERWQEHLLEQSAHVPTFAAAVVKDGRVVYALHERAALCSCSTFKVAVGTTLTALASRGALDLDVPVVELASDLRFADPMGARVTLRMLLSHTAGLDDTDDVEPRPLERLGELRFVMPPGRAFRYSNVGFDTAASIAAAAVGSSHEAMLREVVLHPLGMTDTVWTDRDPLGCPTTSARDLALLALEQLGGQAVLDPAALAEMHRIHADSYTASPARHYGLGIAIETWEGRTLLSHGGGLGNYGTAMLIDPESQAAAVFLFDNPAGYAADAHGLLDAMLGRATRPRAARGSTIDWRPYVGAYDNGARLVEEGGLPAVEWQGVRHVVRAVDDGLFASDDGISLGLLPGDPPAISVNDFILIGARPGQRRAS